MAWERRAHGRMYFYLSRRVPNGKVRKQYVGTGKAAEAMADSAAAMRELKRIIREREKLALAEFISKVEMADRLTGELARVTAIMTDAVFVAAGFHRYNYGPWRKRREQGSH